uniref:Helix-turn-helix domain-containing protein n=1 Tax=Desulfacinum infernum TaxID=35837 RepID=A0A832A325_9BACT
MARMTVRTAAQALGVSPDTLEEYLERTGKMESIRQGKRVFIPAHEVKALLEEKKRRARDTQEAVGTARGPAPFERVQESTVSIPVPHYDALLEELGRLRYQSQLLEFYRTEAQEKNALLLEKEHLIGRLEAELTQLKKPWWRRLLRR